ncbi:S1C family serine protease [bacterium]|nr:S1C family serine protease [bacterium]
MSSFGSVTSPGENRFRWLLLAVIVALGLYLSRNSLSRAFLPSLGDPNAIPRAITPRGDLAADEQATVEIFESVSPSTVFVTTLAQGWRQGLLGMEPLTVPQGTGSGFVWDEKGNIVTNFHVIASAARSGGQCRIRLKNGEEYPARFVGADPDHDIAVVKIEPKSNVLRPIPIGTSKDLLVGQKAFTIGNPFGYDYTLTAGLVSALGRSIQTREGREIQNLIQTDAAISPGSSGGPLLDSTGRLIGMTTAVDARALASNIGFAVPVDVINRIVPELIREAGQNVAPQQASLGILVIDERLLRANGIPKGVMVRKVEEGSAAEKSGLKGVAPLANGSVSYGDLITAIDDAPIDNMLDLRGILRKHKPGDTVRVKFDRFEGGQKQSLDAELVLASSPQ